MPAHNNNDLREELTRLLDGISDAELHALAVQALRKMHRERRLLDGQVEVHAAFPRTLIPMLAERKKVAIKAPWGDAFDQFFLSELERPFMLGVFEFVTWMMRAGLAWPLQLSQTGTPIRLRLTRAGERFVKHDGDHPLAHGYVERLRKRCPGLPQAAASLLVQSGADHALTRGNDRVVRDPHARGSGGFAA